MNLDGAEDCCSVFQTSLFVSLASANEVPSGSVSPALSVKCVFIFFFFSYSVRSTYSSDDVSSQHPVCLLVAEDLHHAVGVGVGFGPAVGREGEFADFVRDTLRGAGEGGGSGGGEEQQD